MDSKALAALPGRALELSLSAASGSMSRIRPPWHCQPPKDKDMSPREWQRLDLNSGPHPSTPQTWEGICHKGVCTGRLP